MKPNHILICGLGSIGTRHLRHFRDLGLQRIDAFRTGKATVEIDPCLEPDRTFEDLHEALAHRPEAVIVCNPTSMHLGTAIQAVRHGCDLLVEKPLGTELQACRDLRDAVEAQGVVAAVACNMRFHPLICMARSMVSEGNPAGKAITASFHCGGFLPGWHPWEDYRQSYAARADLGGGAALTLIHEIDFAMWLFGRPVASGGSVAELNPLGTDVEEACSVWIRHESGVLSTITLSLNQNPETRDFSVVFERGLLTCDLIGGRWELRENEGIQRSGDVDVDFSVDLTFRNQAEAFLRAVRREEPPAVSVSEGIDALEVVHSISGWRRYHEGFDRSQPSSPTG